MKEISERTLMPISLVVIIVGGIIWLSSIYSKANSLEEEVSDLKITQKEYVSYIQKIDHRLSRIEGKLGVGPKD